jgi:hypothetical protein
MVKGGRIRAEEESLKRNKCERGKNVMEQNYRGIGRQKEGCIS